MSYTALALSSIALSLVIDLFVLKTSLIRRKAFWTSYAIILPFQLLTNWWLTSRNIVIYDPHTIVGKRLAGAPLEDLLFGFSLILLVLSAWVRLGRIGTWKRASTVNSKK
jgi:lycopene cyclase domain-containing protein